MLKQFLEFIRKHKLFAPEERILLAVSGGLDSMVMILLFIEGKFNIAVAHANFKLRGEESDGDEAFVRSFCEARGIPFFTTAFDTNNYAAEKKISIQMAARELRYVWFRQLIKQHGFTKIATAHHQDDQAETIFLNMVKGEGLNGLTGMPINKRNVVRPLMFASKENLEHYARNTHIKWREDSTNKEDNYHRNFIRHQIFPRIHKINPGLNESLLRTSEKAKGEMLILKYGLEMLKAEYFSVSDDGLIKIKKVLFDKFPEPAAVWRLLDEFGFTLDEAQDLLSILHQHSGKIFLSTTYKLVIDRDEVIVQSLLHATPEEDVLITGEGKFKRGNQAMECKISSGSFTANPNEAWLDHSKLKFPLIWRKWRDGDRFMPLGMTGFKKVSDFLIDEKVSIPEKEKVTVIESAGEIVWVVGMRIDERLKQNQKNNSNFILTLA
jgi:tRNA(Ile)-lysidine synthase